MALATETLTNLDQNHIKDFRMFQRKLAIGLTTLAMLTSGGAHAHGLFDFVKHALPHEKQEYRSGTINQDQALSLYSEKQKLQSFEACADQFPDGKTFDVSRVPPKMKALALCSDHFGVLYSQTSKTPLIVVERLNAALLRDAKGEQRTNEFYPDPRIPKSGRAELSDYRSQQPAVDRGHLSPAADAANQHAMAQSFALSNMVPQSPELNRNGWAKIESDVRKFAMRAGGDVFVFTGPLFDQGFETVGVNKVWKPTRLYKLVFDASSQRAWAYVLENKPVNVERPMDYASFVQTTGLHLLDNTKVTGSAGRG